MVCLVTQMTVMQLLKGRYSETVHFLMCLFLSWNVKIQNKVSVFESVLLRRIRMKRKLKKFTYILSPIL